MYLANDVIQNSKKKGPEFGKEFGNVLRKAFENMAVPESDEKTRKSIERILQIWEERGVYEPKLIKEFRRGLGMYWTTLYVFIAECGRAFFLLVI
jgi:regulator of Ty1 transposition protein 103